jgi:hypothetical protein
VIPTLPLRPRNRLAATILAALADEGARTTLQALAAGDPAALEGWLGPGEEAHRARLLARARRAAEALAGHPPRPGEPSLARVLEAAAVLFDAGLYFEVHELLEPAWQRAAGARREALQGLIQVAVGYQHLANGNVAGARSLLAEGAARLAAGEVPLDVGPFLVAVRGACARLPDVTCSPVPPFPRSRAA